MHDRQFSFPVAETLKGGTRVRVQPDGRIYAVDSNRFAIGSTVGDSKDGWSIVELDAIPFAAIVPQQLTAGTLVKNAGVDGGNVVVMPSQNNAEIIGMNLRLAKAWSQTLVLPYNVETASVSKSTTLPATAIKPSPRSQHVPSPAPIASSVTTKTFNNIPAPARNVSAPAPASTSPIRRHQMSAKQEFEAAIVAKRKDNPRLSRSDATREVTIENPELHQRMLLEAQKGEGPKAQINTAFADGYSEKHPSR